MLAPLALYLTFPLWLGLTPLPGNHDPSRLLELVVLTAALMKPQQFPRTKRRWTALGVTSWASVSCLLAAKPTIALRECLLFLGLGAFIFQVSLQEEKSTRWLLRLSCAIGTAYSCVFFLTALLALTADGVVTPFLVVFGFDNARHLNHTQTVLIPLAMALAATDDTRLWRTAGWISASLAIAVTAFLMGRATLLSAAIAVALGACLLRGGALPYLRQALPAIAVGMCIGLGLLFLFESDVAGLALSTGSGQNRLILWRAAVDDADQSIFGVGPMHFSRIERGDAAHPHNFYLQTAAEFGWPAAIALVAGVLWALTAMARRVRQSRTGLDQLRGLGLWVTMVAIALDACVSGNLVMPMSQVWVAMAVGLALGWYRGGEVVERSSSAVMRWMRYLLAVSMLVLTLVSAYEFAQPNVRLLESQYRDQPPPETYSPRFWRDGWF